MLTIKEAKEHGWGDNAAEFVEWFKAVDAVVQSRFGVGVDDLPDWMFADAFEDGIPAAVAADLFMMGIEEDFGCELLF